MSTTPSDFTPVASLEDIAERWTFDRDIPYLPDTEPDDYRRQQCLLDVFHPKDTSVKRPVLVHFHGGGFTGGSRGINDVEKLLNCVQFTVEYRLSPAVRSPAWIEDGAAAAAWVLRHAAEFGGDPNNVFVYGESAGAFLTSLLAADRRYLGAEGTSPEAFRGFISLSGEMMTHFLIRSERGIPDHIPVIDEMAPLHYIRPDFPPFLMLTGGTGREIDCRPAENKLMRDLLVFAGNTTCSYYELPNLTHGNIWHAVLPYMRDFISAQIV